jgi:L-lactate permease
MSAHAPNAPASVTAPLIVSAALAAFAPARPAMTASAAAPVFQRMTIPILVSWRKQARPSRRKVGKVEAGLVRI